MVDLSRILRRPHQARRIYDKPARERHFVSIICNVLSFIFLVIALALGNWGKGETATPVCTYVLGPIHVDVDTANHERHRCKMESYNREQQIFVACIMSVTALILLSSVIACIISAGYPREKLEFIRHYGVFNIVSLLCIILVAGLWLAVVETLSNSNRHPYCAAASGCGVNMVVHFGYGFYLLLVGGLFALGAASFNLLFARSAAERRRSLRLRFRQQQDRNRQLAERSGGDSSGNEEERTRRSRTANRRRPPPMYTLIDTGSELTTDTDGELEAETSLSEPEYSVEDNLASPPPYAP